MHLKHLPEHCYLDAHPPIELEQWDSLLLATSYNTNTHTQSYCLFTHV